MVARRTAFFEILVIALLVCPGATSFAISPPQGAPVASASTVRLQHAVRRLNTSLVNDANAENWRRLLQLNVLETQSARGEQAHVDKLYQIHDRFLQHAGTVDDPAFVDVRNAIQDQISLLIESQAGDLPTLVSNASQQYQPISIEGMTAQRDSARDELLLLKSYYRKTMVSADRANLFFDMKIDEAIELLDTVNFELAPELSVGKMNSKILGVQGKLDKVILQIDAIPIPPDSDKNNQDSDSENPDANQDGEAKAQDDDPKVDKNQKSLAELNEEKSQLEAEIEKLKDQRAEIRKSDTPRRTERVRMINALRRLELNFAEIGKERGDPYFVSATTSFERFVRTYLFGTSDNLREDFLNRLATLEMDLLEIDGPNQRAVAAKVGNSLQWMENANQIPSVVAAIRAKHSFPNVYVSINANFLNKVGAQPVTDVQCVRENIGGRLVRGIARTNGLVTFELQDDPSQVHARIRLQGTVGSETFVQQGKTKVYANTTGQLTAWRSVCANLGGFFAQEPVVGASFCSSYGGTSSCLKLVDRIARKKFGQAKGQGERITERKARDELYTSFKERTDEPIQNGKGRLADLQGRMIGESQFVPDVYLRSFTSEIMAVAKKSSISALAAQNLPGPAYVPTDVCVRLHDSMLSVYLDKTFSGKTYTDEELVEEIGSITGDESVSLTEDSGQEDQSFSITFATVRPVQFEFDDNRFSVIVSGRRFAQGGKKINEGLKIILRFKIKRIDGNLKFVRDGQAEIDYLTPDERGPATVAFRSFLLARLNPKDGGKQMAADLPNNLIPVDSIEALQDSPIAKQMDLVQCRSENGWLYVGWNYRLENSLPIWQVDLPAVWNETVQLDSAPPVPGETQPAVEPVPNTSNLPQPQNGTASTEVNAPAN